MLSLKPGATLVQKYKNLYQLCLDNCTAYTKLRWVAELSLVLLFIKFINCVVNVSFDSNVYAAFSMYVLFPSSRFVAHKLDVYLQQDEGKLDVGDKPDDLHSFTKRPAEFRLWYYCIRTTAFYIFWGLLIYPIVPLLPTFDLYFHGMSCFAYMFKVFVQSYTNTYHNYLHICKRHTIVRWIAEAALMVLVTFCYALEMSKVDVFFIYYTLGISMINSFNNYLRDVRVMSLQQAKDNSDLEANDSNAEFRPYLKRPPELVLWCKCVKYTVITALTRLLIFLELFNPDVTVLFLYNLYWTAICVIEIILIMIRQAKY
ncbi:Rer1 family [Nakaseomyces glabratus]